MVAELSPGPVDVCDCELLRADGSTVSLADFLWSGELRGFDEPVIAPHRITRIFGSPATLLFDGIVPANYLCVGYGGRTRAAYRGDHRRRSPAVCMDGGQRSRSHARVVHQHRSALRLRRRTAKPRTCNRHRAWALHTRRHQHHRLSGGGQPLIGPACVVVTFHRGWRTSARRAATLRLPQHHDPRLLSGSVCGETAGQRWNRLGKSNPGPAHYEEAAPRPLWLLPATTVAALTPLGAPTAP